MWLGKCSRWNMEHPLSTSFPMFLYSCKYIESQRAFQQFGTGSRQNRRNRRYQWFDECDFQLLHECLIDALCGLCSQYLIFSKTHCMLLYGDIHQDLYKILKPLNPFLDSLLSIPAVEFLVLTSNSTHTLYSTCTHVAIPLENYKTFSYSFDNVIALCI